jgi:hypothetical protein
MRTKLNAKISTPMAEFRAHMRQALHRAHCGIIAEQSLNDGIVNFEVNFNARKYNVRLFDVEEMKAKLS